MPITATYDAAERKRLHYESNARRRKR